MALTCSNVSDISFICNHSFKCFFHMQPQLLTYLSYLSYLQMFLQLCIIAYSCNGRAGLKKPSLYNNYHERDKPFTNDILINFELNPFFDFWKIGVWSPLVRLFFFVRQRCLTYSLSGKSVPNWQLIFQVNFLFDVFIEANLVFSARATWPQVGSDFHASIKAFSCLWERLSLKYFEYASGGTSLFDNERLIASKSRFRAALAFLSSPSAWSSASAASAASHLTTTIHKEV